MTRAFANGGSSLTGIGIGSDGRPTMVSTRYELLR